ncbi:MAG: TRAP transporter small permease [Fusobacteriaceae bacterium]
MEKIRNKINKVIIIFTSLVLILLVLAVTWQVVSRYILNSPSTFTDEFSRFSLIWIGLLGATYSFGIKAHLSIDLIITRLKEKNQIFLKIFIAMIVSLLVLLVQIIGGGQLSLNTMGQLSPSLQIPMGVVYSILPLSGIINLLYMIIDIIELKSLLRKEVA